MTDRFAFDEHKRVFDPRCLRCEARCPEGAWPACPA